MVTYDFELVLFTPHIRARGLDWTVQSTKYLYARSRYNLTVSDVRSKSARYLAITRALTRNSMRHKLGNPGGSAESVHRFPHAGCLAE